MIQHIFNDKSQPFYIFEHVDLRVFGFSQKVV